ncbi:MAG: DUF3866 family protein [Actinomycetota bacterium]
MLRRARVISICGSVARLEVLEGPLAGEHIPGLYYAALGGKPRAGEEVIANTLGPEMGLGTGGVAVILPHRGGEAPENQDHFVKLPYTPLQYPAPPPPQAGGLSGVPVVVLPLHSHLAPACCAAAELRPGCAVTFVWQEGGALPVAFSRTVPQLKEKGLLRTIVSAGNCFGGDIEAPNVYAGLLAAASEEVGADLILAGIGPGVVGTASPFGHGGMAAALALNAACALGADPVLAPRVSAADGRERHRGISHHTRTALRAALGGCRVALPESYAGDTGDLPERHRIVRVRRDVAGSQAAFGITFESMGRRYEEDPAFFDAAAAAVALALGEAG